MLIKHLEKHSHQTALKTPEKLISYKKLLENLQTLQSNLKPLLSTQKIALNADNSLETIQTLIALLTLGKTVYLLDAKLPENLLLKKCNDLQIQTLLTHDPISTKFVDIKTLFKKPKKQFQLVDLSKDAKTILFSSGTTNSPKQIIISLKAHLASAKSSTQVLKLFKSSRYLHTLPLCHVSGLAPLFRSLIAGSSLILDTKTTLYESLERNSISHVSFVLTQLKRLLDEYTKPIKTLRAVLIGGSFIPPSLVQKAYEKKLPLFLSYGMTETSSMIACQNILETKNFLSSGKPLPHCKLTLLSQNKLAIDATSLFDGYLSEDGSISKQSPFLSPDMVKIDEDGYLYILGRNDDLFISGGYNISPSEIEKVMLDFEGISQVKILPIKDSEFGHVPIAFYESNSNLNHDSLKEYLKQNLKFYQIPKQFILWEFPSAKLTKADTQNMLDHFQNINQRS